MRTKTKEKSLQVLEKELDSVFSDYIRARDSNGGRVKCFICGVSMPWKQSQNLHFIPRAKMPTRYDEMNCHAGCESCNCFDKDHDEKYALKMVEKYGHMAVDELQRSSQGLQKFMRSDLIEMIEEYKGMFQAMKKYRGL